jgi:hypothetical protein
VAEFIVVGMLPAMTIDLDVPMAKAGWVAVRADLVRRSAADGGIGATTRQTCLARTGRGTPVGLLPRPLEWATWNEPQLKSELARLDAIRCSIFDQPVQSARRQ